MLQFLPRPLEGGLLELKGSGSGPCCSAPMRIALGPREVEQLDQLDAQLTVYESRSWRTS